MAVLERLPHLRSLGLLLREGGLREARLLTAAQSGDRRAYELLTAPHREPLRAYVSSRIGQGDLVEDVLQEIFIAAWTGLPRYTPRSPFKAWLFQIAYHKCMDHHRARYGAAETGTERDTASYADPHDRLGAAETRIIVRTFLAGLPEAQREVMEMYYYGGLTLSEVAEALGRNLNTIKAQFYRAHAVGIEQIGPTLSFDGTEPSASTRRFAPKGMATR